MPGLENPHDRYFKELLSRRRTARGFLRNFLPPGVSGLLDLRTLSIAKGSFVDPGLRAHLSDLVYRTRFARGGEARVYVLFEHKSRADPAVGFQLLRYVTRLWEQVLRQGRGYPLPPVVPVVLYHGRESWRAGTEFSELIRCPAGLAPYVPRFRFVLVDLRRYSDLEIRAGAVLRLGLPAMRHVFDADLPERLPGILRTIEKVALSRTALDALEATLRYLTAASDRIDDRALREAVTEAFPEEGGNLMSTLAERWMEEGREKGLWEGSVAATREAVVEALDVRFGEASPAIAARLRAVEDVEALKALHRKALTAGSLEEFLRALEAVSS